MGLTEGLSWSRQKSSDLFAEALFDRPLGIRMSTRVTSTKLTNGDPGPAQQWKSETRRDS